MSLVVYVGDSSDVIKRIRTNHCSGNVEGSAFRKHVAAGMGFGISRTKRSSGSTRVRLDLDDPSAGERTITKYVRSGFWKVMICDSYEEAHDFQWYAIQKLDPPLNKDVQPYDQAREERYTKILRQLVDSDPIPFDELSSVPTGPGVYVFHHDELPAHCTRN